MCDSWVGGGYVMRLTIVASNLYVSDGVRSSRCHHAKRRKDHMRFLGTTIPKTHKSLYNELNLNKIIVNENYAYMNNGMDGLE